MVFTCPAGRGKHCTALLCSRHHCGVSRPKLAAVAACRRGHNSYRGPLQLSRQNSFLVLSCEFTRRQESLGQSQPSSQPGEERGDRL